VRRARAAIETNQSTADAGCVGGCRPVAIFQPSAASRPLTIRAVARPTPAATAQNNALVNVNRSDVGSNAARGSSRRSARYVRRNKRLATIAPTMALTADTNFHMSSPRTASASRSVIEPELRRGARPALRRPAVGVIARSTTLSCARAASSTTARLPSERSWSLSCAPVGSSSSLHVAVRLSTGRRAPSSSLSWSVRPSAPRPQTIPTERVRPSRVRYERTGTGFRAR